MSIRKPELGIRKTVGILRNGKETQLVNVFPYESAAHRVQAITILPGIGGIWMGEEKDWEQVRLRGLMYLRTLKLFPCIWLPRHTTCLLVADIGKTVRLPKNLVHMYAGKVVVSSFKANRMIRYLRLPGLAANRIVFPHKAIPEFVALSCDNRPRKMTRPALRIMDAYYAMYPEGSYVPMGFSLHSKGLMIADVSSQVRRHVLSIALTTRKCSGLMLTRRKYFSRIHIQRGSVYCPYVV